MKTIDFDMAPVMLLKNGSMIAGEWVDKQPFRLSATWEADAILDQDSWPADKIFVYVPDFGEGEITMDFSDIKLLRRGDLVTAFIWMSYD